MFKLELCIRVGKTGTPRGPQVFHWDRHSSDRGTGVGGYKYNDEQTHGCGAIGNI